MRVDGKIGGSIDGTGGADLACIADKVVAAERVGYGVWSTAVSRDGFLPLMLAADRSHPSIYSIGAASPQRGGRARRQPSIGGDSTARPPEEAQL
jgi:hypothetical protein